MVEDPILEIVQPKNDCLFELSRRLWLIETWLVESKVDLQENIVTFQLGVPFQLQPKRKPVIHF